MKKYSLLMGLMCAALSITSCSKDNTETFDKPKGYEFELYAAPQTRTEVDGLDMKWSANDAMNVFHAPTGTTNYSSNDQFTVSDIEGGVFKGTISDTEFDPNGTYDWYAVYPYSKYMASPAESNSGSYFVVGSKNINTQQQTGIDNQAHICGENIPLYGKATGVTESPRLAMHHIATLFRINVINTGSADLNVTGITLTSASENLIGSYYFDITGETPVLTPYRDDYVSKTATLNITDGVVAPDATGSFYLATRAFTAPEGEQLTLTVTANGETVEKVATLSKETTFAAGKINKLNINVAAEAYVPAEYAIITNPADIDVTATYFIGGNNEKTVAASPTMHMFTGSVVTGSNDWRLVTKEYTFDSSTNTFNDITGIAPVTLENAGVENTYYIKVGENYLCNISTGTTSGEKGLALQPTDPTAWTFETDTKKEGIYASSTLNGEKYILSCNGSSDALRLYDNTKYNGIYFFTEAGTPKTALDAPTNVETTLEDANTVYVGWDAVQGAASYTVSFEPATIEPQTVESTGEATYLNLYTLDYATEYTVSVVANPADTENYKASAPATATFTTGENPNHQVYTMVGDDANLGEGQYIFAALNGTEYLAATSLEESKTYGYLPFAAVTVVENKIASNATNDAYAFTLEASDTPGQYYLKDTHGRYMYNSGSYNTFNVATSKGSDNTYLWAITVESDGTVNIKNVSSGKWMQYDSEYHNYAIYDTSKGHRPYAFKLNDGSLVPPTPKPILAVSSENVAFAAAGESKEVTYTAVNLGSNQVFAAISGDGAGQFSVGQIGAESIPVTAAENTETTAKTATLTLYIAASEGGEHLAEATVALTQAAKPTGDGPAVGTILWQDNFSVVSGTTKLKNLSGSNDGFTEDYSNLTNVYSMTESIRVGTASKAGSITLPVLTNIPEGNVANIQISFKAEGWNKKTAKITLSTNTGNIDGDNTLSITSSSTMAGQTPALSANAPEYTYRVTGVNNLTTLTLDTNYSIGIDDLKIIVID